MQSEEERNKVVVRRYAEEVWGDGDLEAMDEILTEDQTYHDPTGSDAESLDDFKQFIQRYHEGFPDLEYNLEGMIAEGDMVAFWGRATGVQEGEFMGIEPTGRRMDIMGIGVVRIEDGKIAERWANFDTLGMLRQLGVYPT